MRPHVEPPTASRGAGALIEGITLAALRTFLALLALSVVESLVVSARIGRTGRLGGALGYLGYAIALSALLALVLGALMGALSRLSQRGSIDRQARAWEIARAAALGVSGAFATYLVMRAFEPAFDRYHIGVIGPLVGGLGVLALQLAKRRVPAPIYIAIASLLALSLLACDLTVMRGLYLTLHDTAALGAVVCAAHASSVGTERLGGARRGAWLLGLVLLSAPLAAGHRNARELGSVHGAFVPKLTRILRVLTDRDRDGFAPGFGGDCDDGNPQVYPSACELSGNSRDDNCNGLAGSSVRPQARVSRAAAGTTERRDVYLIVIDTLRADYGGPGRKATAPELERFAAGALDFTRAYTPYPSTFRAMLAMSTSRAPRHTSAKVTPLLGYFRAHGYDSQLWIGPRRLRDRVAGAPTVGLDRTRSNPFKVSKAHKAHATRTMIDDAIAELAAPPEAPPRLRWLHILDVHGPRLLGREDQSVRERYVVAARYVDGELARLFRALEADARGRNAVIAVVADHGEELGEHGGLHHGAMLWEASIHIPIMLRLPGVAPRRDTRVASLIDLLPTLASYLGLPASRDWHGYDLLAPPPAGPRVVSQVEAIEDVGHAGLPARTAVTDGSLKLIANIDEQLTDVYDIARDPHELTNLAGTPNPRTPALLRTLAEFEDLPDCER